MDKKKNGFWKIPGLEVRYGELVRSGMLLEKDGLDKILQTLRNEFAEKLGENFKPTKHALVSRLSRVVWTKAIRQDLKRAIRHRLDLDEFYKQYFAYIPRKMWDRQVKFLKGLSDSGVSASFVAGVGRLITEELKPGDERFEFPENSYARPFEIQPGNKDWNIPILNGANIGIDFDPNIEDNPLRRGLSDAEKRKAAAVVLTNLIDLHTKKTAGVGHIYRAQVSGLHINLKHLPESYRKEAARILKERPRDEVVFQNIAARFLGVLDALHKISHRPKNRGPEFTGRVLYALGYKEEELINEAANAELRYIRILKQNKLITEMQAINRALSVAEEMEDDEKVARLEKRRESISQQLVMAILTNVSDEDRNYQRRRIRALFVKKVQENIPNCTVISQGSAYLKVGDKIIKIHLSKKADVTDTQLAKYEYGIEVFTDTLANITVICHPHALNHRLVGREDSKDGQPVTKFAHVAPILVDDVFLRYQLKDAIKEVHPIHKCVNNPQFRPGVLVIKCTGEVLGADSFPIPKLDRFNTDKNSNFAYPYPKTKYITWFLNTDNHFGAPDKRNIWDPKNRVHLGTTEAAIEMIRREGLINSSDIPIHCTAEMDDATNGDMWFKPRYRPDPQVLAVMQIEHLQREMAYAIERAAEKGQMDEVKRLAEEMIRFPASQFYLKGDDFPFHQMMQVYDRHIEPNVDFYSAVLGKFVKSELAIRGISKINRTIADTRDVGVHNFPNGNHRIKTLEQTDLEGDYIARQLQEKLLQFPEWQKYAKEHPDFLKETVRAPRFGNETYGWGTIKSRRGFEWGVRVHGSPTRQNSWADILAAQVKSDLFRGDDSYGLGKYITVVFFGDKHFYAMAETYRMFYIMCAAGVHTNLYGSTGGFPPNNTGPCFVSIPADGPDAGPIIMRSLPHDVLRDWFAKPWPLNLRKLLPEPV